MPLTLYRRHTSKCTQHRARHERTYEGVERRRGFKKCSCPIHIEGRLGDVFSRKTTGTNAWEEARRIASVLESAVSWNATVHAERAVEFGRQVTVTASESPGITVADAGQAFMADCRARGIASSTYSKYRTFVKQLEEFSRARAVVWVDQWDVTTASDFRLSWRDEARSSAKEIGAPEEFLRVLSRPEVGGRESRLEAQAPRRRRQTR